MKVQMDIENSKTNNVISIEMGIIRYDEDSLSIFDISKLSNNERKLLEDAINPKLPYIDIEMFFMDESNIPYFGPDYIYRIKNNRLYLEYNRKKYIPKEEEINEDWTLNFNDEFDKLVLPFIESSNNYILVYYDEELKCNMYKNKPSDDIFMKMFFDDGYNALALFKKNNIKDSNTIRNNLTFINSYCEDDKLFERR